MFKTTLTAALLLAWTGTAGAGTKSTPICDSSAEANRKLVVSFYTEALVEKRVRSGFQRYVSPNLVEHKPDVPAGDRSVVVEFLEGIVRDVPGAQWEIIRTIAEKDLVFLHARFTPAPGAPDYAIADVFRVQNCQIVEHWDVVGPPRENMPNTNSRF